MLKDELGIGLCNITKCCTEVCPEEIHITDNAITAPCLSSSPLETPCNQHGGIEIP